MTSLRCTRTAPGAPCLPCHARACCCLGPPALRHHGVSFASPGGCTVLCTTSWHAAHNVNTACFARTLDSPALRSRCTVARWLPTTYTTRRAACCHFPPRSPRTRAILVAAPAVSRPCANGRLLALVRAIRPCTAYGTRPLVVTAPNGACTLARAAKRCTRQRRPRRTPCAARATMRERVRARPRDPRASRHTLAPLA